MVALLVDSEGTPRRGRAVASGVRELLVRLAAQYETAAFLEGDPSRFMHEVSGEANMEATAFTASVLSYGSRKQFLPKIESILAMSGGKMDAWIAEGGYEAAIEEDDRRSFYRFQKMADMRDFFDRYRRIIRRHGSLGGLVRGEAKDGISAVRSICNAFSGAGGLVPKDASSACKRVCMFLRWMARPDSPVDLGLWKDFIDRATLVMPLDVHVRRQACSLGLFDCKTPDMRAAVSLSATLSEIFPGDPLKGDFALFGYGADASRNGEP